MNVWLVVGNIGEHTRAEVLWSRAACCLLPGKLFLDLLVFVMGLEQMRSIPCGSKWAIIRSYLHLPVDCQSLKGYLSKGCQLQ